MLLFPLLVETFSYSTDKFHVILYEAGLRESLKKIDVLFKISHIISIHISNMKNVSSISSENSTINYLSKEEINFMIHYTMYMYRITSVYKLRVPVRIRLIVYCHIICYM